MKVCEICGEEISTRDGENRCRQCEEADSKKEIRKARRRTNRAAREDMMRSLGLVKVRGALGGTYWE